MDIFDNEIEIINFFQDVDDSSIMLIPEGSVACEEICLAIKEAEKWQLWKNSSGKADPPPDFFSDALGYMMEVMRVDDHGYISKKGKTVNPMRQRETQIARELRDNGFLDTFPNARLFLIVDTGLPTHEDHNYDYYRDNFVRAISVHIKKIPTYKQNHPTLKTVFFVFDEASPYMQVLQPPQNPTIGTVVQAQPHFWFMDKEFIDTIKNSAIDYFVWFTPYKHCKMYTAEMEAVTLPEAVVIDVQKYDIEVINYNAAQMESVEL